MAIDASQTESGFHIVGIGASAGGLESLERFFTRLPADTGMAFVVLFADDDRLYARNGWARVTNRCSWVRIHDHATLGIARQEDTGAMMVKAIGEQAWPEGDVDLLGHLF